MEPLIFTLHLRIVSSYYRPHLKDDGRLYFQSVHTLGGYPIQPWTEGGYPIQPWAGGSTPTLDGGVPHPMSGEGVPQPWTGGVPHVGGVPHPMSGGYPPTEIASTCYGYAAGGVPLAFTQEDFLVIFFVNSFYLDQCVSSPIHRLI